MQSIYEFRFGTLANHMLQMHCLLSANQYSSWRIPTGQNKIDWTPQGWNYVNTLYQTCEHPYQSLEEFTKALLCLRLVLPQNILLNALTNDQLTNMERHYIGHLDNQVLPSSRFRELYAVRQCMMFQSLWLGAGYTPTQFNLT